MYDPHPRSKGFLRVQSVFNSTIIKHHPNHTLRPHQTPRVQIYTTEEKRVHALLYLNINPTISLSLSLSLRIFLRTKAIIIKYAKKQYMVSRETTGYTSRYTLMKEKYTKYQTMRPGDAKRVTCKLGSKIKSKMLGDYTQEDVLELVMGS